MAGTAQAGDSKNKTDEAKVSTTETADAMDVDKPEPTQAEKDALVIAGWFAG